MRFSTVFFAALMMYGESTTAILAATSPLGQGHLGIVALAFAAGFIGTANFFTDIGKR